jgi:serine/threonine-protein kinase
MDGTSPRDSVRDKLNPVTIDTPPASLGRYEIRSVIGRGMMGVVYEAVDPALGRTVALKTIQLAFGISGLEKKVFEERFFTEARLAAGLTHPNIVVVHDVGWDEPTGTPFMALEYLHGETLSQRLESGQPMDWREALRIAARVADGLHVAHAAGVVHRDIKPANIMLLPSGEPKIMDFGIAKAPASELTAAGDVFGTPSHMSPEQATGVEVDGRSDIFSLGTILYQMLTGRRAFDAPNVPAIMARVTHEAPESPLAIVPTLPPSIESLLARCLAKDPLQRYPNGRCLAEDLEHVSMGHPILARPGLARTLGESGAAPVRRRTPAVSGLDASGASPSTLAQTATASYEAHASGVATALATGETKRGARDAIGPSVVLAGLVAIAVVAGTLAVALVGGDDTLPKPQPPPTTVLASAPTPTPELTPDPSPAVIPAPAGGRKRPAPRTVSTRRPTPTPPGPTTPTPVAATAPRMTPAPTPVAARLKVNVEHSMPSAELRIRALTDGPDRAGTLVIRRRLRGEEGKTLGVFTTHRGEMESTVDVPIGEYFLRVESERDGKLKSGLIRGRFRSGRTVVLAVRVRGSGVELQWE